MSKCQNSDICIFGDKKQNNSNNIDIPLCSDNNLINNYSNTGNNKCKVPMQEDDIIFNINYGKLYNNNQNNPKCWNKMVTVNNTDYLQHMGVGIINNNNIDKYCCTFNNNYRIPMSKEDQKNIKFKCVKIDPNNKLADDFNEKINNKEEEYSLYDVINNYNRINISNTTFEHSSELTNYMNKSCCINELIDK